MSSAAVAAARLAIYSPFLAIDEDSLATGLMSFYSLIGFIRATHASGVIPFQSCSNLRAL